MAAIPPILLHFRTPSDRRTKPYPAFGPQRVRADEILHAAVGDREARVVERCVRREVSGVEVHHVREWEDEEGGHGGDGERFGCGEGAGA